MGSQYYNKNQRNTYLITFRLLKFKNPGYLINLIGLPKND